MGEKKSKVWEGILVVCFPSLQLILIISRYHTIFYKVDASFFLFSLDPYTPGYICFTRLTWFGEWSIHVLDVQGR